MTKTTRTTALVIVFTVVTGGIYFVATKTVQPSQLGEVGSIEKSEPTSGTAKNFESDKQYSQPVTGQIDPQIAGETNSTSKTANIFSSSPANPFELYSQHIEQAEKGDAQSMHRVSIALGACTDAPRDRETHLDWINQHPQADIVGEHYQALEQKCRPLLSHLPNIDFVSESQKWLEASAVAGHATSRARLLLDVGTLVERAKPFVESAVRNEDHFAYYVMEQYLLEKLQPKIISGNGPVLSPYAWSLAACRARPDCDYAGSLRFLELDLHEYQLAEVTEIQQMLELGNIDEAISRSYAEFEQAINP